MQGQQVAYKRSVTWVRNYLGIIVGLANRLVMQSKQLAALMLTLHHAYGKYTVRRFHSIFSCTKFWEEGFDPRSISSSRYPLHVNLQQVFTDSDCKWHDTSPRNRYRCEKGLSNMEYGSVPDPSNQTLYAI
ncbi:uncharacterized protein Bfra_011648 [Botrytis fragariae]|uniref:Uncharacterized protein n=1 Tax=Botrytis fragariae TaxID=1964551 RepID=A0A8H6AKT0_9HELO|nr:uncharacterized protein Bfra_011648 [Botrytis fragariae]KAF5869105.1 hypothetical protein Bfra_011648 [Botrytis fragariae]